MLGMFAIIIFGGGSRSHNSNSRGNDMNDISNSVYVYLSVYVSQASQHHINIKNTQKTEIFS